MLKLTIAGLSAFLFMALFYGQAHAQTGQQSPPSMPIRQSIHGTTYDNETSHFSMTVPSDWFAVDIAKQLNVPGVVGGLAAPGGVLAIMIQRYMVQGAKNAAQTLDASFRSGFRDYRKISEGPIVIDNRDSYSLTFHAMVSVASPQGGTDAPAKLLIVLIPDGQTILGFTCEAPESDFDHFKPICEKIVTSFHSKTL
jgi:hypothetical protein